MKKTGGFLFNLYKKVKDVLLNLVYLSFICNLLFRVITLVVFSNKWYSNDIRFHICDMKCLFERFFLKVYFASLFEWKRGEIEFFHSLLDLILVL